MKMNFIFLMILAICYSTQENENPLVQNVMVGGYRVQDDAKRLEAIQTIYEPMMRLEKSQPLAVYLSTCDVDKRQPVQYLTQVVAGTNHKFLWDKACGDIQVIIWEKLSSTGFKADIKYPDSEEPISFEYTKAETDSTFHEKWGEPLEFGTVYGGKLAHDASTTQNAISEFYYPMLVQESNPMKEFLGALGDPTSYSTQVVAGINHIFTWNVNSDMEVIIWQKIDGTYQATIRPSPIRDQEIVFTYSV